jgi:uncharacterized RDD family membrane protein YckC
MNDFQQQDLLTEPELHVTYGNFWPRFGALFLDGLILLVLTPVIIFNETEWKSLFLLIIISAIQISYKPFFEYRYGATPGKMALRLKVVNYEFQQAKSEQIIIRNIFGILSGLIALGISIYTFSQADFLSISTMQQYSHLGYTATATLIWESLMFIIFLIDFIFLVSSADSRSLHDRMGKTFVIRT